MMPSFSSIDVGIARSGSGVDVALESANVIFVKNELIQIPYLIKPKNR